ncbi:hypothetical protein EYF80_056280 [Liparis tanakae]|uniref:Uncharacterized protein n=1 Tax=Liparis tanakae TaxID=230148 RepID=A0A4Z2EXG9_9TELE|nr:hypothetical protein EYF80_056280 [Liparis tanakae]
MPNEYAIVYHSAYATLGARVSCVVVPFRNFPVFPIFNKMHSDAPADESDGFSEASVFVGSGSSPDTLSMLSGGR